MSDIRADAQKLEIYLSTIMRGLNRKVEDDPLMDLPMAQFRLLRALGRGIQTPSELAPYLSTSVSAVTQIANRLEAAELIEREEDPNDRRVLRLVLSPKGATLVKRRGDLRVEGAECLLSALSVEDRETVMRGISLLESTCEAYRPLAGATSLSLLAEIERAHPKRQESNK